MFKEESEVSFKNKAHTIPKSLGGQNFNRNVCDLCNSYFGNPSQENKYSIESALKETFCISRELFLIRSTAKRQIGKFKSMFFEIKTRNGKRRLGIKSAFLLKPNFQEQICRDFKRGLYKMWFEELDRQTIPKIGYDSKYDLVRNFSRYNQGDVPVIYFERSIGIFAMMEKEAEIPTLMLNRMKYLYEDDKFAEIEFLGHVFGFPIVEISENDFKQYIQSSMELKKEFFSNAIVIQKLVDIDFALTILNK